jgi:glycosyltransferase involved in cell wall biosynthesis
MRIAIATVQVPFLYGGAELHAEGLRDACREAGHEADIVTHPFRYEPAAYIRRSMSVWESEDFGLPGGGGMPDLTICLRFPAYAVKAPRKALWLLHQHRSAYDLWDATHRDAPASPDEARLRDEIVAFDTRHLGAFARRYANSANVARRLKRYNGLDATPLYHPPALAAHLYTLDAEPYIFFPSRLESLKRQSLLIEAMRYVRSPVVALLGGIGGQQGACESLIAEHGLHDRVRLLGAISNEQLCAFYAASLAVFFGPVDEDLGYVTLEAMLAAKPVITCTDSGGPLEFVVDGETGCVVPPEPEAIAAAIDRLAGDRDKARAMGEAGRARYDELGISWQAPVDALLAP